MVSLVTLLYDRVNLIYETTGELPSELPVTNAEHRLLLLEVGSNCLEGRPVILRHALGHVKIEPKGGNHEL